jgi:hypothetical protein
MMLLLSKVWPHCLMRIGSVIICFVIGSTVLTSESVIARSSSSSSPPTFAAMWNEEIEPVR